MDRLSTAAGRLARTAAGAARRHPLLVVSVAALAARQLAVSWSIVGSMRSPPNTLLTVAALAVAAVVPAFAIRAPLGRIAALVAVDLVLGALFVTHLVYYRQFGDLPTAEQVAYAMQSVEAGNALSVLLRPQDVLLFAGGSLAALLVPRLARTAPLRPRAAVLAVACALLAFGAVVLTSRTTSRAFARRAWVAMRLGPIGYTAFDGGTFLAHRLRRTLATAAPEVASADAAAIMARRGDAAPSPLEGAARGRNVIVVQLESVQAFTLDAEVGGKPVTPTLRALAVESIRFDAFHAQVAQGNTSDAELAVHCSLYPLRTGSVYFGYAANDFRCLPELLREAGYTTSVFHGNRASFWNRERIYPALGVERYHHIGSFRPDQPDGGLSDEAFFAQSLPILERMPEPFYAVFMTLTNHIPFDAPFVPHELEHGPRAGTVAANYLDSVRYTDRELGRFVEGLRRAGLLDRSVLVVYGDHHGVGRRNSNVGEVLDLRDEDAVRWFGAERRVPLLVRVPGAPGGAVIAKTGGQVDLAPTLLSLLGLPREGTAFLGQDLLAAGPGFVVLPNGSAATDDRVLLTEDGGYGRPGCYRTSGGERIADAACAALADRARAELALSTRMLDGNTVALTAALTAPASAPAGAAPVAAPLVNVSVR